jgi:hypothetical protein
MIYVFRLFGIIGIALELPLLILAIKGTFATKGHGPDAGFSAMEMMGTIYVCGISAAIGGILHFIAFGMTHMVDENMLQDINWVRWSFGIIIFSYISLFVINVLVLK